MRKVAIFAASFCRRFDARSITAAWRMRRARSSGVKLGSRRFSPSTSATGAAVLEGAEFAVAVWVGGGGVDLAVGFGELDES